MVGMPNDEVAVLREALSNHRAMLTGALSSNEDLDIGRAFQIHAEMTKIINHWDDFSANEQREVVATVQYVIDSDDDVSDLTSPDGFADDAAKVEQLRHLLGYV